MKGWLLPLGLGGAGLAALCCFTPLLPWLFSLLGISGALGYVYRDDVLLPILADQGHVALPWETQDITDLRTIGPC